MSNKITTQQIREKWIAFWQSKQHLYIPCQSLIPKDDDSILWINSGVATLKKFFSGEQKPPKKRIVNNQLAIRTNDITSVGVTSRHHTIFEMLGNFSIGDYFKEEAIKWSIEFLTSPDIALSLDKLYITCYKDDEQTRQIWQQLGINPKHIIKCDRERNFWDLGKGPCGPCTEIYYDRGEKYDPDKIGEKLFFDDIENNRYVEIWNIVFSQYNNDGNNNYTELANKNIDTGMGLERLVCILQDKANNFDTDIFVQPIKVISQHAKDKYPSNISSINTLYYIIVDHLKACCFAIADGEVPSAKERGYIIRKLIRRAMLALSKLGCNKKAFDEIVQATILNNTYDQTCQKKITENKNHIKKILDAEYELFNSTLVKGLQIFNQYLQAKNITPESVFTLYERYGFPIELIFDLCETNGITIDEGQLDALVQNHREKSKDGHRNQGMNIQHKDLINFNLPSEFVYEVYQINDGKIIAIFDEKFKHQKTWQSNCWVVFDKTPFYATSGGQNHDIGTFTKGEHTWNIDNVTKNVNGQHLHHIITNKQTISVGDTGQLTIDRQRRLQSSYNHTVEHLLQASLQLNIDQGIKQQGAYKCDQYVTFDFNYTNRPTNEQLLKVQKWINEQIAKDLKVNTALLTYEEAMKTKAMAIFTDVYKKVKGKLRVVSIGAISTELCAGTHATSTKELEQFLITDIENKGENLWRITALTTNNTINNFLNIQQNLFDQKVNILTKKLPSSITLQKTIASHRITPNNIFTSKELLNQFQDQVNKLVYETTQNLAKQQTQTILQMQPKKQNDVNFLYLQNFAKPAIIEALDKLGKTNSGVFLVVNVSNQKTQVYVTSNITTHKANELIKQISASLPIPCFGGGNDNFAQAGANGVIEEKHFLEALKK